MNAETLKADGPDRNNKKKKTDRAEKKKKKVKKISKEANTRPFILKIMAFSGSKKS